MTEIVSNLAIDWRCKHTWKVASYNTSWCLLFSAGVGYAYLLSRDVSLMRTTQYGNVLLSMIVLVAALLPLAALNKFTLVPSLEPRWIHNFRQFQRSIQFEIAIALIILIASCLLTMSMTLPMGI